MGAAEEIAIELGWLRECPYHGEPLRARGRALDAADPRAGAVHAELLAQARMFAEACSESCPYCARESLQAD